MLELRAGGWFGWVEAPVTDAFPASPIFVTGVAPLKSGKNLLQVEFIQPLAARGGRRRSLTLCVGRRTPTHLAADFDEGGWNRSALLTPASFAFLEGYCGEFWSRRPVEAPSLHIVGQPAHVPTVEDHLRRVFGKDEDAILAGAKAGSFGSATPPMPAAQARFELGVVLSSLESTLAARGYRPGEMEEKWFIYLETGRLLFRRSWTGLLVWSVETAWEGDRLRLGAVTANRDPAEYKETDDGHDKAMLLYVLTTVLLGSPARFPVKAGEEADAPLKAWSVAGKASLS